MRRRVILPRFTLSRAALVAKPGSVPGTDLLVLAPAFAGLTPMLADIVGVLPIRAVNASLMRTVDEGLGADLPVLTGMLAVDPFITGESLFRALAAKGVTGVVNLPSVALADGALQAALGMAGLGIEREWETLALAPRHGLSPVGLVFSYAEAMRAAELGIRHFLLHPGLPSGDERLNRNLAEASGVTIARIRQNGFDALLYRHPTLEPWLPGQAHDAGQLTWCIGSRELQSRP